MSSATSSRGTLNLSFHRRKSQVFVEIPPSPLFKGRVASTLIKVDDPSAFHIAKGHKENAPPLTSKTSMSNFPPVHRNTVKRKVDQDDDGGTSGAKKAKIPKASNESDRVVICHQCRSKKSPNFVLQCMSPFKKNGSRCQASYCDTCLRNRYGKDLTAIAKRNSLEFQECDSDKTYHFICPRCDGNCNCAPCRKRRGLAPVGKFFVKGGESVREILERNPEASGLLPKHTVAPVPKDLISSKVDVSTKCVDVSENSAQGSLKKSGNKQDAVNHGTKKTPKVVPEPVWVPVRYLWSKTEIENRIQIREFVLRFNPILNIGLRNLEELDDFTSLHDLPTKAILLSLLDLLAIEDEIHKKIIQETIKIVRSLGTNWAKIVPALYDLRNSMPRDHALHALPDLIHSDTEPTYYMRGGRIKGASADQLLPILLYLIQVVCEGASVRQELEEGYKQAKEIRTAYLKATREEQERWTAEKAKLTESKPGAEPETKESTGTWKTEFRNAEAKHKAIVAYIQNSHKPETDACASRFRSLGRDIDGRIYYALSASGPQRGKKERLPSESERFSLKRWGWFIAVYGKPGAVIQHGSEDDTDEDKSNEERWWGFADVEEMRKLSKWLAYCGGVDTSDSSVGGTRSSSADLAATLTSRLPFTSAISGSESPKLSPKGHLSNSRSDNAGMDQDHDRSLARPVTSAGMKALAKAVLEFAEFIDWRLNREQTNSKRKGDDSIAPIKFYD